MFLIKILNFLFPKLFFCMKSGGGNIGLKTRISLPYIITGKLRESKTNIKIGNNVEIRQNLWISMPGVYNGSNHDPYLEIGNNCKIGKDCIIACTNKVKIGNNLHTSARVFIGDSIHEYEDVTKPSHRQPMKFGGETEIGDDCFIGINACLINCKIGDHVVIGANSVVTKDIPSFSVAAGVPARVIKQYNFDTKKWEKLKN